MEKETIEDRDKRSEELLKAAENVFTNSSSNYKARRGFIEGANWQAERMYSRQDLVDFVYFLNDRHFNRYTVDTDEVDLFIEQLKEK